MNLLQLLSHPEDRPALLERGGVTTYGGLRELAGGCAAWLRGKGVGPGDRVLLMIPLSAGLYAALAAVWQVGAVAVLIDPGAGRAAMEHALGLSQPKALLGVLKAQLLRLASPGVRRIQHQGVVEWLRPASPPEPFAPNAEHPALVTFTSGSTGKPKGIVRSHGFLLGQYQALTETLDPRPGELSLATLPVVALVTLASGGTVLVPDANLRRPGHVRTAPVLRQLMAHPARSVAAAPAFLDRLAGAALDAGVWLPFEKIFVGGGPVFPAMLERLAKAAPQARITAVYGSTEAEPIAETPTPFAPEDQERTAQGGGLLAGKPVPSVRLKVLPDLWGQNPPPGWTTQDTWGKPGEVVVSGEHVVKGYLQGQGDAETKFRDEEGTVWHRTGDAGCLDTQGRLWLLGRCSARAGDLYPFAVEAAAQAHKGVERAALSVQDGRKVLWVVWGRSPDPEGLGTRLAWAGLDEIRPIHALPMDARHNSKIDYTRLAKLSSR